MLSKSEIKGFVTDTYGKPIADVIVIVQYGPQSHHDLGILTNNDGTFKLTDLVPGEYVLFFSKDGFISKSIQTKTNSSSEQHLIVKLEDQ